MSYCLITGRARSLPKPNFFPIIPPVSPADARRLCRITGKRMDTHNYCPLLEVGKRPECVKCSITGKKSAAAAENPDKKNSHLVRNDFKYVTPILRKDVMEQGDAKAFEDLQKVLKRLRKSLPEEEREKMYAYMLPSLLCGLIVPAEVEEAIKMGEMETVSLSKTCDKAIFKVRGKPTLFVPLKEIDIKATANNEMLLDGMGQSKETLSKQKKVLEEKKRRTLANKKIFEDLERQADEELQKDLDRPKGQARVFSANKSKEAKEFRQKLADFKEMYLPKSNMGVYGPHWVKCLQNLNVDNLDWGKIDKVRQIDLDTPLPAFKTNLAQNKENNKLSEIKRIRNVYIPDGPGLEIIPYFEAEMAGNSQELKIPPGLEDYIKQTVDEGQEDKNFSNCWSLKSMFAEGNDEAIKILPTLEEFLSAMNADPEKELFVRKGCIYDNGDGPKFCDSPSAAPKDSNVIVGAIFKVLLKGAKGDIMRFFPGHFLSDGTFVPGQRMSSVKGEFIPAACIKTPNGHFKHIPGIVASNKLVAGQFIRDGNDIKFLKGQVIHTKFGSKYIEGETVHTADGLKFVAGVKMDGRFTPGAVIDEGREDSRFMQGQMISDETGLDIIFLSGEMGQINCKEIFVPGQRIEGLFRPGQMVEGGLFIYGEIIISPKGNPQFLPGIYNEAEEFLPGLVCDTNSPQKETVFVQGKLYNSKDADTIFVPGSTTLINDGQDNRFEKCKEPNEIRSSKSPSPPPLAMDSEGLSLIYKKVKPKNGTMVMWANGSQFFPEGAEIPQELIDSGAESISGRMECTENGPQFVAGKVMEIHGIRTFIPGKMIRDENTNEMVFVPGKMIMDGKNGPRFLPGQVIESEDGDERFIPGQIMDSPVDGIKRFVPGQIIETKSGPVFIPGQVLRTDNGLKFVPGVIVETSNGSAVFVPSQVLDSPEGARLLKGHIVDTPDGPRLLPPDIKGDGLDLDYIVQGFDIDPMEARLILGGKLDNSDFSDVLDGIGGSCIGSEALRALAEGFQSRRGNVIKNVGEGEDVDKLLQDEMLDSCDSPPIRKIIRSAFLKVFSDLCQRIDEVIAKMNSYINDCLLRRLDGSLMMDNMKLNPALESLKKFFESKSPEDPAEYDILNLVAGVITCSIPGALKECCSDGNSFEESKFRSTLLSCIEDSIKGILEEDGTLSNGLMEDIKELVTLAKELEFDENESFFAKVEAVTEGRCNSKFMDTLLKNLRSASSENHLGTSELLSRLINILAPRLHLQSGFKELSSHNPDFVQEVLECLKGDPREIEGFTAIDILHHAITKVINNRCQRQLDDVVHKVELDEMVLEKDQDIRSMLEQAIGLAKYMGKSSVIDSLFELLGDPIRLEAIRDDPVIKDVLNKILVMQRLTAKDTRKRQKLEKLQRYHHQFSEDSQDEDDKSLKELIKICEALTRPPNHGTLKKSKSMVKKSKSMIMTAKDIPMNAFMAMKNTAHEKDEKWLQNFLSESLVEEIPWECSKALIILKEGFQAIIPREASRSILMGEASYTLIDDNGVEFYLSPKDKMNRKKQGLDDSVKKVTLVDVPEDYHVIKDEATPQTLNDIKEENITTPFDDLDDYRPSKYRATKYEDLEDDLDDGDTMKSLEKYRPSFYEVGPPRKSDDINDIRDYYTNMMTRTRAIRRFNPNADDAIIPQHRYDPYADNGYEAQPQQYQQPPQLDDSTRHLLEKSKSMRSRPMWEPEERNYDRTFDRPSPPPQQQMMAQRSVEDSMMSSKTRSLLDKVRESTNALADMSSYDDYGQDQSRRRKQSRFLKRDPLDNDFDVGRMADDILGESLYPEPQQTQRNSKPTRKYSYQSSLDTDRFSDRSSPLPPSRGLQKRFDDDDELDAMINDLKQKTSRRDMQQVLHDIEGENGGGGTHYGRKSVSPIPKPRDLYSQPEPNVTRNGNNRRDLYSQPEPNTSQRPRYDPYDHVRGGTGFNFDFERPQQQQQQQQPQMQYGGYQAQPQRQYGYGQQQQPQFDPYGGYGPPQPQMRYQQGYGYPAMQPMQPMYQAGGYGSRPSSRRPPQPTYGYYE